MTLPEVTLVTDGAVSGNPGPGGWAAILLSGGRRRELSGAEAHTTNNRMELTALLEGLRALRRPCRVHVLCDSAYVVNAHRQGWIERWQRNGWRTAGRKPVENRELWEALIEAERPHELSFELVKGHAGHVLNEEADALAVRARLELLDAGATSTGPREGETPGRAGAGPLGAP